MPDKSAMQLTKIIIRNAFPEDAPLIAWTVATAIGEETLERYCGNAGLSVLEILARTKISQYSFQNSLVAEINSIPVGVIVGYDGALLRKLRPITFALIHEKTGKYLQLEEETQAGEFYLDSVSVYPEFRGRGIGRKLILKMCERAFAAGHQKVGLLVDAENPRAEKLYSELGFVRITPKRFCGNAMWHLQKSAA